MVREILLLGNPELYAISTPVKPEEIPGLAPVIQDLRDTLLDYRARWGAGRAIAAPQIGVPRRLIYMHIDHPVPIINPKLTFPDDETMEVLDDCMSFPHLLVKVLRHRRCRIDYLDETGQPQAMTLEGDLAELLQHEYDHLDGILATMRAIDQKSFVAK